METKISASLIRKKRLTHGKYPLVSLAEAREKREEAKKLLLQDIDPGAAKRESKAQTLIKSANTFEAVAREWHEHNLINPARS